MVPSRFVTAFSQFFREPNTNVPVKQKRQPPKLKSGAGIAERQAAGFQRFTDLELVADEEVEEAHQVLALLGVDGAVRQHPLNAPRKGNCHFPRD